ncbi:MAG: hypothetical protein MR825_05110, partial [Lawsonibacter sp.]|nr:hypothetical protein [Lawsonibacter sp.]
MEKRFSAMALSYGLPFLSLAGRAKSVDTEFLPHVVIHGKTYDLTVITVQNGCDVKLSVCARDLR